MLCSPITCGSEPPHLPSTISSTGSLRYYRQARKPIAAGNATNCLKCPIESTCKSSAVQIYWRQHADKGNTRWPVKIVVPEMEDIFRTQGKEAGKERLMEALAQDYTTDTPKEEVESRQWYGRCVWESNNDVCDDQAVTISWDDDPLATKEGDISQEVGNIRDRGAKTAIFHMVAQTQAICTRRGRIYGSDGELHYNSSDISVTNFHTGHTKVHHVPAPADSGHGGGDDELALNMVKAVLAVRNADMNVEDAQWKYLGVDLEEVVRSHAAVFAADDARTKNMVVDWKKWWDVEVASQLKELGLDKQ